MKSFFGFTLAILAAVLLTGCGKTEMRLHLAPKESRSIVLTQELSGSSNQSGTGKTINRYRFDVENVDPDGNHHFKVTIEQGGLNDLPEMGPIAQNIPGLDALKLDGKEFRAVVGPLGNVTSVTGMDAHARELSDKFVEIFQKGMQETENVPPLLKNQLASAMGQVEIVVRKMLRQQLGDAAMRDQLSAVFSMYTDQPVRKGSEWTKTYSMEAPLPMNVSEKWVMVGKEGDVIHLSFTADVVSNPNAPALDFLGMQMTTSVSGKVTGTAQLDASTGWPLKIVSEMDLKVDVGIMGMSMARNMKGTQTWETVS